MSLTKSSSSWILSRKTVVSPSKNFRFRSFFKPIVRILHVSTFDPGDTGTANAESQHGWSPPLARFVNLISLPTRASIQGRDRSKPCILDADTTVNSKVPIPRSLRRSIIFWFLCGFLTGGWHRSFIPNFISQAGTLVLRSSVFSLISPRRSPSLCRDKIAKP